MWRIRGIDRGGRESDVQFIVVEDARNRNRISEAVRQMRRGRVPAALERELTSEDPLPGIDGVETWGERAVGRRSGLTYGPTVRTDRGDTVPGISGMNAIAFHFPDAVVADVSGMQEIEVSNDQLGIEQAAKRFEKSALFLEWRAYLGEGTLTTEGEGEFVPDGKWKKLRLKVVGGVGTLIGRVAGWMGRENKPDEDPFLHDRLTDFETKHPTVAKKYPDLALAATDTTRFLATHGPPATEPVLVFIHGTFSCAIPAIASVDPLKIRAFRFEHDTFTSIQDNAAKLVQAVLGVLKPDPLHLVAHSRGGLVARLAARELHDKHKLTVIVRTYGTPHRGTPLANAGGRMLSALLSAGRIATGGIFSWDPPHLLERC